jgi:IS5 family transposase
MAHREIGQLSLADGLVAERGRNESLERIAALVDWAPIGALLSGLHASVRGPKSYPPLMMLKALLLQQWHGLGDVDLEAMLGDRISFRRFCAIALDDATPDHVTISNFRRLLVAQGLADQVFAAVAVQIAAAGLLVKRGTLIAASLIAGAVKRPRPPQDVETAETPARAEGSPSPGAERAPSKLVRSPIDPEAAWSKKGGVRRFGYKAHVAVDAGSGIIRRHLLTPGNVNDTVPADQLIIGDERAVYADQAYDSLARRALLKESGIKNRIMRRANKHHPLSKRHKQRNTLIGKVRGPVEQVFSRLKGPLRWARVRYIGVQRNAAHLALLCTALNLMRWATLRPA